MKHASIASPRTASENPARQALAARLEDFQCWSEYREEWTTHAIQNGVCTHCEYTINGLAIRHGLDNHPGYRG
jgi:hypothetical protein